MQSLSLLLLLLLLTACSTTVKRPVMGERGITPQMVVQDSGRVQNIVLEWGGAIVDSHNLPDTTEFQILAFPLRNNGQPNTGASPTGRFIAVVKGYQETADYPTGRQVTLSGRLQGIRQGKVGEAAYRFPVLEANEIMRWPITGQSSGRSAVRFGIGAGSGSWSGGSIGIGIGF
jgi:outer membrane lipoprotein